jgi:hypothetical protein
MAHTLCSTSRGGDLRSFRGADDAECALQRLTADADTTVFARQRHEERLGLTPMYVERPDVSASVRHFVARGASLRQMSPVSRR